MRRVDAHQHFWTLARSDYGWLTPAAGSLYADFMPADLAPLLHTHGVAQTVLVQAAPTVAETEYLLRLAGEHSAVDAAAGSFIGGVVGWVDLLADDADAELARLAANPLFKGVRPMLQDLADEAWIAQPALQRAARALTAQGLSFDALVHARHLPHLLQFARRHPELPIVIDHLAKPAIAAASAANAASAAGTAGLRAWRDALAPLAALPNVHAKLSGLVTEAGAGWTASALRPWFDEALALFTPQRLMWGSDWPVLNLAADYARWVEATQALLAGLSATEQHAVWAGTAQRFYRLQSTDGAAPQR